MFVESSSRLEQKCFEWAEVEVGIGTGDRVFGRAFTSICEIAAGCLNPGNCGQRIVNFDFIAPIESEPLKVGSKMKTIEITPIVFVVIP